MIFENLLAGEDGGGRKINNNFYKNFVYCKKSIIFAPKNIVIKDEETI